MTATLSARPRVRLVAYGPPALEALREAVHAARGRSALDPVTVVVPSALAGVTLRRALAQPGTAGIRFCSLPQLRRDLIARAGAVSIDSSRALRHARLRGALGTAAESWPAPASSRSGVEVLDALMQELDEQRLGDDDLDRLAATGGRAPDIVELYRAVHLAPGPGGLEGAAATNVPVVLHLPRRLSPADLELCTALADQHLLHPVLGLTGDMEVDAPVHALAAQLGPVHQTSVPPPATPTVRLAADAEEEVRGAVRDVLARLAAGGRPDRMALVYRSPVPYARLVHEQLHAAGVPHHVPRQRSLAQALTGSLLLGLLALPGQDWSRQAVLAWLGSAPVRLPDGTRPALGRLDRLACEAGVTRGASWQRLEAMNATPADDADKAVQRTRRDRTRLVGTVQALRADTSLLAEAPTWAVFAQTCHAVVLRWLLDPERWSHQDVQADRKVEAEQQAHEMVLAALAHLAHLDGLDAPPALGRLDDRRDAVQSQFGAPVRESTGLGRGVLVAPLAEVVGADLDLLLVLGAVEGAYPPRLREHPLLRDDARTLLRLRTTADRRGEERRDHLAALRTAQTVVLSAPVADGRAQRRLQPSPWLLENEPHPTRPGSFQASLAGAGVAATGQEQLLRSLLNEEPVRLPPGLARGLTAVDARRRGAFGPWLGGLTVADEAGPTERLARGRSASALQDYATCPFRWYMSRALGLQGREEPAEDDVSPLDRGELVHAVLEELVHETLGRHPDLAWSPREHARATSLLEERAQRLAAQGKAGRPAVWDVRVAQMRRVVRRLLLTDDAYRRARRARPRAVEWDFGIEEADPAPVSLTLPSGREVSLRGSVDRVDVTDGGTVVVLDYKTGKSEKYGQFPKEGGSPGSDPTDLTDRGRRLQLPLYALAAQREHGTPDSPVEAYYSFVDEGGTRRGGVVGDVEHARLLDVLDVTMQGMADGVVPANPGSYDGYTRRFENCGYCAFDRTCSSARDDQWEAVRRDPRVAPYTELAEGVAASEARA